MIPCCFLAVLLPLTLDEARGALEGSVRVRQVRIENPGDPPIAAADLWIEDGVVRILRSDSAGVPVREIDGRGLVAVPAFVDPYAVATEPAAAAGDATADAANPPDEGGSFALDPTYRRGLHPEATLTEGFRIDEAERKERWSAGFGAALVVPGADGWSGQSAVCDLADRPFPKILLLDRAAQHLSLRPPQGSGYPSTLMGVLAHVRQFLHDAERNARLWERYRRHDGRVRRPELDPAFEAVRPVLDRDQRLFLAADSAVEIRAALSLSSEFGLRPVIVGGRDAWRLAAELHDAGAEVVLALDLEERSRGRRRRAAHEHDHSGAPGAATPDRASPEDEAVHDTGEAAPVTRAERETQRLRRERAAGASVLHRHGVPFAFTYHRSRSASAFREAVSEVIEAGLPREAALAALTRDAAARAGLPDALGRLFDGARANVALFEGDPLDPQSPLRHVFAGGAEVFRGEGRDRQDRPAPDAAPAASVTGTWEIAVQLDSGERRYTFELRQEGERLSGAAEAASGPGEVSSGSVSGDRVSFIAVYAFGDRTYEFQYHGTLGENGDAMSGTVSINGGTAYPFEGRRTKKPEDAR